MNMRPIEEFDENAVGEFILVFSPIYQENNPMRFRILQSQFVNWNSEITHFIDLRELEQNV